MVSMEEKAWGAMTPEEKRVELFLKQKETLRLFYERGAITNEQHDKSLHDLIEKMGMEAYADGCNKN